MNQYNQTCESMNRAELEALQLSRLKDTVRRVYENVPFYRERFDEQGIKPEDVESLSDLERLPFMTKEALRDNYPFGLFAVPIEEVVRVHASSGTTGKPTVVGYTAGDIDVWAEIMARTLVCAGATKDDMIQIAYGYGLFTGGLGVHYGAERLGATVIPISGGNTKRQIMLMQDFGSTVLACTPSYALYLAETMQEMGIDPSTLKLRIGVFGAEPWSDGLRKEIEHKLGVTAIDIYGLSEVIGPGVASECLHQQGLHVFEDHFIPEIIDPVTGKRLPPGSQGELVFTSLTKEAFPIIRYRTRDISKLDYTQCTCGRTMVRMHKVMGRTDDMLIIRGVNVFPSQIESVLIGIGQIEPHYLLVVDRSQRVLDELEIWVEVSADIVDEVKKLEQLGTRIRREIQSTLGIQVRVKLVEPKTIERTEGKSKRVVDRREL
ncbi:MAG: phenylacetate--CoA ligase [Limnochordia bacterium]|nr:phenylacetate--CoA ligase [Limnochordia bacterium]MDD2630193.1 phenylacetate--CoA ligase [Limnochordia bacterium]MDD4517332.1 phenylacetate--CoA ligase [Limnochordia bacterium]